MTVGTRFIAQESILAVPMAVAITALWWNSMERLFTDRSLIWYALLGAGVGTAIGIFVP